MSQSKPLSQKLDQAQADFMAGRVGDAVSACDTILAASPGHVGARRLLGLAKLVSGDVASALKLLKDVQDHFPDDPHLATALAEAYLALGAAGDSLPHYRRALVLNPAATSVRVRYGSALLQAGLAEDARRELQPIVAGNPDDAAAVTYLGMAMLALGQPDQAVTLLECAVRLDRTDPTPSFQLGQALRALGRIEPAAAALREAARRAPDRAFVHIGLGDVLLAQRDEDGALRHLRRATSLEPDNVLAWIKRGEAEQCRQDWPVVIACYRQAVALQPDQPELHTILGNALYDAGDIAGARDEFARGMQALSWMQPASSAPVVGGKQLRVGVLAAPGGRNTPTDYILDRAAHRVEPIFMLDGFQYPAARIAQSYDVIFNAITDPDAAPGPLAQAAALVAAMNLPVVDPPDAIPGTERNRMADCLAGIPGLVVPRNRRVRPRNPRAIGDLRLPLLIRPVGSHGGGGIVKADTVEEARAALARLTTEEAYVTEFYDYRSADGLYRKLRIVFVDGTPYPVHMAIGDGWLSHYFRTHMDEEPGLRAEEAAFLRDPAGYMGPVAYGALAAIHQRVGLGYFGLDGALTPQGDLLLFECNATMLVRHIDRPAMFDYKRAPAERVRSAVSNMLRRLAAKPE